MHEKVVASTMPNETPSQRFLPREHLRSPAYLVAGRTAELDLLVAGDWEHAQHGQTPGARPLVRPEAEPGPAGGAGQPPVPHLGAQRGGHAGHGVWLRLGPPGFLQGDDVRLEPMARPGDVERLTVTGQAPVQVQARQRDRAGLGQLRPG